MVIWMFSVCLVNWLFVGWKVGGGWISLWKSPIVTDRDQARRVHSLDVHPGCCKYLNEMNCEMRHSNGLWATSFAKGLCKVLSSWRSWLQFKFKNVFKWNWTTCNLRHLFLLTKCVYHILYVEASFKNVKPNRSRNMDLLKKHDIHTHTLHPQSQSPPNVAWVFQ